jgi:ferredoxin
MRAIVDTDLCIGCALCAETCPEVFVMMDDGFSHPMGDSIPHEEYDCVQEAIEICPVSCISMVAD